MGARLGVGQLLQATGSGPQMQSLHLRVGVGRAGDGRAAARQEALLDLRLGRLGGLAQSLVARGHAPPGQHVVPQLPRHPARKRAEPMSTLGFERTP